MKAYLVVYLVERTYTWEDDWGTDYSVLFTDRDEALTALKEQVGEEIADYKAEGINVHINPERDIPDGDYVVEEFYTTNGDCSVLITKWGWGLSHHVDWTLKKLELEVK